jgi:DNA-binding GntR family transcriptional regulator/anti-sigma regulatory factor (Ser/Thr protein kinase)
VTRTERAYRHLIDEVLAGRWQPGETPSTYALAEELRMSRTPVVEAMKRLEAEGLVEIIPQVGCRIIGPTATSVQELYALREAFDGLAAEAAARRIGADELSALESVLSRLEAAVQRRDRAAYLDLNLRLHLAIVDASGMPRLVRGARSAWLPLRHQLANVRISDEALDGSLPEHREIVDAIRRGAPKRARTAAERHARTSGAWAAAQLEDAPGRLTHRALIYITLEDFLDAALPFVEDGLDREERVLTVTTPRNREALARALGARAGAVEFHDSDEWYRAPSHTLLAYERYLQYADSARVRILGEPIWSDLSPAAIREWTRYESLINVEFAFAPVSFLCPYDAGGLAERIVADARRTHPELCIGVDVAPSPDFRDARAVGRDLDGEAFEEPEGPITEHSVTADLGGVRTFALEQAERAGLSGMAMAGALLAVQELAANAVLHGPRGGTLRAWLDHDELIFEMRDDGAPLVDPMVAQMAPDLAGRQRAGGLWTARLLSDLVEVRSGSAGFVARLHLALS